MVRAAPEHVPIRPDAGGPGMAAPIPVERPRNPAFCCPREA